MSERGEDPGRCMRIEKTNVSFFDVIYFFKKKK